MESRSGERRATLRPALLGAYPGAVSGTIEELVGIRVALARKAAGLTQEQLAERVGLAMQSISRLERGAQTPGLAKLQEIASVVGVELPELLRPPPRPATRMERAMARVVDLLRDRSVEEVEMVGDVLERVWRVPR